MKHKEGVKENTTSRTITTAEGGRTGGGRDRGTNSGTPKHFVKKKEKRGQKEEPENLFHSTRHGTGMWAKNGYHGRKKGVFEIGVENGASLHEWYSRKTRTRSKRHRTLSRKTETEYPRWREVHCSHKKKKNKPKKKQSSAG